MRALLKYVISIGGIEKHMVKHGSKVIICMFYFSAAAMLLYYYN
jgi:hypothetical protein